MSNKKDLVLLGSGLNCNGWRKVTDLLNELKLTYKIYKHHKQISRNYHLGILLGYSQIVPTRILNKPDKGFVLFHSSDLPRGRGWAPIYNTIVRNLPLVQTMLYAIEEVDAGPMIAKASYSLEGNEVDREVREIDDNLTLLLLEECLEDVLGGEVKGKIQDETEATWWERRHPEDSEIDLDAKLVETIDKLRGLPVSAGAFVKYKERKFKIELYPEQDKNKSFDSSRVEIKRFYKL